VKTQTIAALAAASRIDPVRLRDGFGALMDRVRPRFARFEPHRHAGRFMLGLLAGLERKNCWSIAEHGGYATPDGLQHLLSRARWDADAVRDDLRRYVIEAFGDPGGVFIVDETGDVKKGLDTVGVQRQYTGTAGRIENAQVAVYLTYAATRGHALIDRALYLPSCWATDPARRERAGVPATVEFATKPALAAGMIEVAMAAGTPGSWVAGDEVYGNDSKFRAAVAAHGLGYVLAVACNHRFDTPVGRLDAAGMAAIVPAAGWQKISAGAGSKGLRWYSWALTKIPGAGPGHRWVMLRRNDTTGEIAYYRCYAPHPVSLAQLVRVAGTRWKIEESFQTAKGQAGLDEHQVRRWCSWHRFTTLAMLAMAFLAVATADHRDRTTSHPALIPITLAELRRLFDRLVIDRTVTTEHVYKWSIWRRQHQQTARRCHYHRRSQHPLNDLRL